MRQLSLGEVFLLKGTATLTSAEWEYFPNGRTIGAKQNNPHPVRPAVETLLAMMGDRPVIYF